MVNTVGSLMSVLKFTEDRKRERERERERESESKRRQTRRTLV